jgi:hypothetical protein
MDSKQTERTRGRPPRLIAFGFLLAFAASVLTLIYTGLRVVSPDSEPATEPARADQAAVADARPNAPVGDTGAAADEHGSTAREQAARDDIGADGDQDATASGPEAGSRAPAD